MFGYLILSVLSAIEEAQRELAEFEALCDSVSKEEANRLGAERKVRQREELEHRRKLEIARESRPLNFWGSR